MGGLLEPEFLNRTSEVLLGKSVGCSCLKSSSVKVPVEHLYRSLSVDCLIIGAVVVLSVAGKSVDPSDNTMETTFCICGNRT